MGSWGEVVQRLFVLWGAACGVWGFACGVRRVGYGVWGFACGVRQRWVRCVGYGVWGTVCGVRRVGYGVWGTATLGTDNATKQCYA